MVNGREMPAVAKPEPVREALAMVRLVLPGFCTVMACVLAVPSVTLPKLTLAGVTAI
jgi:hypothetical protein